jgi:hypothetical protein
MNDARKEVRDVWGSLPLDEGKRVTVFAGRGSGQLCAYCCQPIVASEIEYEVPAREPPTDLRTGQVAVRLHLRCHDPWRAAMQRD